MFSTGQLIFAVVFFIIFFIATSYAYKGDKALHQKFYKGSYKVLIVFLLFIGILFMIKIVFKR